MEKEIRYKLENMNIFKSFTLKWWQGSLLKIAMIAGGVAIGAYWSNFFAPYLIQLIVVALVAGAYISYVWWRQ